MGYGDELRDLIDRCGLRVDRLAERAGISRESIHRILNGANCSDRTRAKLTGALASIAADLSPQCAEEHPGLVELQADHQLLASLGATAGDVARVRELLGTRQGAVLILAALIAGRG